MCEDDTILWGSRVEGVAAFPPDTHRDCTHEGPSRIQSDDLVLVWNFGSG